MLNKVILSMLLLSAALGFALAPVSLHAQNETVRVSISSSGVEADFNSYYPSTSLHGRYTAFLSYASNLVPGDTNGQEDIFVHDRVTGTTRRASVSSTGEQADRESEFCSISHNGRIVAFDSRANNLVPGDTWWQWDIFVRDMDLGLTERVSMSWNGEEPNAHCEYPSISADGRYVAYQSAASNMIPGGWSGRFDIYVTDRQTGLNELISIDYSGGAGNGFCFAPSISPDGRYVAFQSDSDDLVPDDTNDCVDIFVMDRQTGVLIRASVDSSGVEANKNCLGASISDNQCVVFYSESNNLDPADTTYDTDIFLHDMTTGETAMVSVDSSGNPTNHGCWMPKISADGRRIAFQTAGKLVPDDYNIYDDIYVHDLDSQTTVRYSEGSNGEEVDANCDERSAISPDGGSVAYATHATTLVPGITNGWQDIFVSSRLTLSADTQTLSVVGGTVNFLLDATSDNASRFYLLLGSVTGTQPGFTLPGGTATLPLNWDPSTDLVLAFVNTVLFSNFMAALDGNGQSAAQMNAPALDPAYVGVVMYFAYCLNNPFDFVSNPVAIEVVP